MDTEGFQRQDSIAIATGDRASQQHYTSASDDPARGGSELKKTNTTGGFGELDGNAVNIDDAKSNYESLRREMSRQSISEAAAEGATDEEKQAAEEFDLTDFLSGTMMRREEEGFKAKRLGLIVRNLTVKGVGADHEWIPTVATVFETLFCFWRWGRKGGHDKTILNDVSGYCKPGEMLLVLGRPGSGCTTLLRVLSEMKKGFTSITGEVKYGGINSEEFGKVYRGEVCYNEEEDINYPTLTAAQTLRFAIRCKTPGKRLPGDTKRKFQEKIIYVLGNMLGLTKQMDTMVGNEFVRGLSGGERKRLTIAEQMTTGSCINCWDCSTRGLDASSALDYVRSLRVQTDILQKTTVATLYQASDSIFHLFDHCMVLDSGHCLYFGPSSQAKTYFEDMGFHCPSRKSTPDFLTGLCNFMEREARPGFEDKIPMTPHEFELRYKESQVWEQAQKEMADYDAEVEREHPDEAFREAFREAHQKHASKRSPFTATPISQIKALTIRQFELIMGDKGALISRYGGVIVKGIIMASVFYNMPTDANGTFSRGGLLFFSLLFNSLIAQSELSTFMHGRRVLEKHKGYALYRPAYFYISQVVADVPLAIIQVIIFELCVYFIAKLTLTAGQFFTFMLVLIFSNLCMNGFFRMFGSLSPNFFIASQMSSCVLIALMIYSGYQIPYTQMHPWLMWIYWINPLAYAYKAILENEMHGQHYSCMGPSDHVPSGPAYTDPAYRTCSIHGAPPGATYVLGDDYLEVTYGYASWQRWINFVAVFLFFCLFTVVTAMCMEFVELSKGGSQVKVYKRGHAPTEETEEEMRERAQKTGGNKLEALDNGTTFSWQHVDYTVPVKGGHRQLLNDIGGIVKPGHLTALMGSSGAGKTTLLDVLAKRKTIGKVDGRMYMNGEVLHSDFERVTGYCEQMDIHNPNATVREALQFSAYLRQPANVSKQEKDTYVEQILELLEMQPIGDSLIGDPQGMKGISVEERKRLTIGVELVAKPQLLFLDEPTSGLDAQSSYNIVRFIRKLADVGWPVLCTIHQPSATLFGYFDHLLLLVRGGRTAYYGPIGEDSKIMTSYFESHGGQKISPQANPAEYILEVVGAGTSGHALQDWADVWENSQEAKDLQAELEEIHGSIDPSLKRHPPTYSLNFFWQLWYVYQRLNVSWWRCPSYNVGRLFKVAFIALISGFSFWKLGDSVVDMQNRLFCIFTTLMMANSLIVLGQPRFMEERQWFRREYASRYYGWAPFAIGTVLVEVPYIVVFATLFMFCFYWTAGLQQGSDRIGYFYILFVVFLGFSVSFGFLIASFSTTATMAAVINPFFSSILILFAGIIQPPESMPYFWRSWMYWLDPYHYLIEGFMVNELYDLTITCEEADILNFRPPPGQTCGQYTQAFFAGGGTGYVTQDSLSSTEMCRYCLYSKGEDYYARIGWTFDNRWRDWGILLAFWIFNIIAFAFFVWLFRKQRR